jgi:hypothetical protein
VHINFDGNKLHAVAFEREFECEASSKVRNELNGERKLHDRREVVHAITRNRYDSFPVMPRPFPQGEWEVFWPEERPNVKYLEPFYIPTDAIQELEVWSLDDKLGYNHPTGTFVDDLGYGLHYSPSETTLGCIRIHTEEDLRELVDMIRWSIKEDEQVFLNVERYA